MRKEDEMEDANGGKERSGKRRKRSKMRNNY